MNGVLVIGGVSLDVLHLPDGRTVTAPGGAGLYTALGAAAAGAPVTLCAPRPDPLPAELRKVAERLEWRGPRITPADLMRLEIAHHGGGRATLVAAQWGALAHFSPADLPADLSSAALAHIAALGSAERQLAFAQAVRARGVRQVSAGTYARAVLGETEAVRALCAAADVFFLNENEARGLFGAPENARARPGQIVFVTLAERGARVVEAAMVTAVPAQAAEEVDPTGAGDVFCGAVLAGLLAGLAAAEAARRAMPLAARHVAAIGPAAWLG